MKQIMIILTLVIISMYGMNINIDQDKQMAWLHLDGVWADGTDYACETVEHVLINLVQQGYTVFITTIPGGFIPGGRQVITRHEEIMNRDK